MVGKLSFKALVCLLLLIFLFKNLLDADRHCELARNPKKIKNTRKSLSCIIGYLEIHPAKKPSIIKSAPSLQSSVAKRLLAPPGHSSLSILGKRNYSHHHNGLDGLPSHMHGMKMQAAHDFYTTNGKTLQVGTCDLMPSVTPLLKRQRQNWLNAPDDGFFIATEETRKRRKQFTRSQLKRACRTPCTLILRTTKSLLIQKETQENMTYYSQLKIQQ